MLNKIFITLIVACSISCSSAQDLKLGTNFTEKVNTKSKVLIPSGSLVNSQTFRYQGIEYTMGIDSSNKLVFVSTDDSMFSVEGFKINDGILKLYDETKIKYIAGWGYYIKINSEWYAGFDIGSRPNQNSKIQWFFKYKFSEGNQNLFKN